MPQHIITESVADHYKYKKAEEAAANRRGWYAFIFVGMLLSGVCWWLQP